MKIDKKQIIDLNDPEFQLTVDTLLAQNREVMPRPPKAVARNLSLENVAVDIGPDVWLRSSEANIKLGGSLNVTLAAQNFGQALMESCDTWFYQVGIKIARISDW